MCEGRVEVIQDVGAEPLEFCPYCGLEVRRVISRASVQMGRKTDYDKAATRGYTTFRRAGHGTWERVAGEGPETIQRDDDGKA
jgi:predicted nucleic acid-binding Zn ribbon protein